jgi:hypothetical protein
MRELMNVHRDAKLSHVEGTQASACISPMRGQPKRGHFLERKPATSATVLCHLGSLNMRPWSS